MQKGSHCQEYMQPCHCTMDQWQLGPISAFSPDQSSTNTNSWRRHPLQNWQSPHCWSPSGPMWQDWLLYRQHHWNHSRPPQLQKHIQNGASSTPGHPCRFIFSSPSGINPMQQDGSKTEVICRGRSGRAEDYSWLVLQFPTPHCCTTREQVHCLGREHPFNITHQQNYTSWTETTDWLTRPPPNCHPTGTSLPQLLTQFVLPIKEPRGGCSDR